MYRIVGSVKFPGSVQVKKDTERSEKKRKKNRRNAKEAFAATLWNHL